MTTKTTTRCCEAMDLEFGRKCDLHDPMDCPDRVIGQFNDGRYGLMIHDGGASMYEIAFCPWCGSRIGDSDGSRALVMAAKEFKRFYKRMTNPARPSKAMIEAAKLHRRLLPDR